MDPNSFLSRLTERLRALRLSDRAASLQAGQGPTYIRDLRLKPRIPKVDIVLTLAALLETTAGYLLGIDDNVLGGRPAFAPIGPVSQITVRGAAAAGEWHESYEWPRKDHYEVTVPTERRVKGGEAFGLQVRGATMDNVYPDGTIVVANRFADLGLLPRTGQRVVVITRRPHPEAYEATLKEYEFDQRGRHILWPRTSDPEAQTPTILKGDRLASAKSKPLSVWQLDNGLQIQIVALVTASIRLENI